MTSTTQTKPFGSGTLVTVNDYGNHRPAKVIERRTTRPSRGGFAYLVEFVDSDLIERASFDATLVSERVGGTGSWLVEWDGGFDTADSEGEAWRKVAALISNDDDGATVDDFKVGPNDPQGDGEELGDDLSPPTIERCPSCGSENICTQTQSDTRYAYGCLDCDHQFDQPLGENEVSQLAGPTGDEA